MLQVATTIGHLAVFIAVPAVLIWGILKLELLWDEENSSPAYSGYSGGTSGENILRESHEDVGDTLR